jgi:hypothetical protein
MKIFFLRTEEGVPTKIIREKEEICSLRSGTSNEGLEITVATVLPKGDRVLAKHRSRGDVVGGFQSHISPVCSKSVAVFALGNILFRLPCDMLRAVTEPTDEIFMGLLSTFLGDSMVENPVNRKIDFTLVQERSRRLHPPICPIGFKKRDMEHWMNTPIIR